MASIQKKLDKLKANEVVLRKEAKKTLKKQFIKKTTHIFMHERSLTSIPKPKDATKVLYAYYHNNDIEKIENLELLYNCTHLHLQWNKIKKIEGLQTMVLLKKLYLGNNSISVVEGLEGLRYLEELHIERQKLDGVDCLCFDPNTMTAIGVTLKVLNVSGNKINEISWVKPLRQLEVLIAKNNKLDDYQAVGDNLCTLMSLNEVNFSGNTMCRKHRYRETLIARCTYLRTIDETVVTDESRLFIQGFDQACRLRQLSQKNKIPETKEGAEKFFEYNLATGPKAQSAMYISNRTENMPRSAVRAFDSSYTIVHRVPPKRSIMPLEAQKGSEVPSLNIGDIGEHKDNILEGSQSAHETKKGILKKPMPIKYI